MTAGETAQVEANMNVVHNILNGSDSLVGSLVQPKLALAA